MDAFSNLFEKLDSTFSTNEKVEFMKEYFAQATPEDAAWALFFLSGQRLKKLITSHLLRKWYLEKYNLPEWLFQESYSQVGDTAEAISLLLPQSSEKTNSTLSLSDWLNKNILPLRNLSKEEQKTHIYRWWEELPQIQCFILNKMLTGSFRVGISQLLTVRALEKAFSVKHDQLMYRLQGEWEPSPEFFNLLIHPDTQPHESKKQPFPFYLASPLDKELTDLGDINEWLAEWKWDGIRSQILYRGTYNQIWSRGNELITEQFPELLLPPELVKNEMVLDGEILAFKDELPLSFGVLQNRLGRKNVTPQMIKDNPVIVMAYDILEWEGKDIRERPLAERRKILEEFINSLPKDSPYRLSAGIQAQSWNELITLRQESRARQTEGLMLKRLDSSYGTGRKKGDWWKYKIDPYTIDAVLLYAQPGSGIRANQFTDYTFAVWDGDMLTPITKAYSGLSKEEIAELDKWIRHNTTDKFGPVRQVKPHYVFEIAFEGIQESKRHKSGIALRFPRIARWRKDKPVEEADKLNEIKKQLLPP